MKEKDRAGKTINESAGAAYIKGAVAGDEVTLPARTSSNSVDV